ncbi:clathrin light chain Clc1 [Schizosaccharomyces pombe]|uniref:Clathrin light chain n=1 Tax=Schizosaccharomyces pombe (strain 972 / ATCC 24843) TaxID=284812 RepID=CLC1_SCHPO|nr:clathrin light chain [Schizosaccharomyces pombe]Q9USP6.1 RecName: Full=Clathrin light chain; Short=CLC [Schizosaccharomyces pombe 972h-]CAB42369.1 clathrin light chain [Schizosaccharomyces pombe]|eukprot:NP_595750.1 clathrin light chain [Schizosaccharomyces pombe]
MSQFPALEDFDDGLVTAPVDDSKNNTDFLEREKLALGEDAGQFETPEDKDALLNFENDSEAEQTRFEQNFPPIDAEMQASGTFSAPKAPYMGQAEVHPPEDESGDPEPVRKWKEDQMKRIQERDESSKKLRESNIEKARKAIDDFYENFNDKRDKVIAKSRKEQEKLLEENESKSTGTTSWERILKLIDLSDKPEAHGRSTERFRELLISLAKDSNAPGAAGTTVSSSS